MCIHSESERKRYDAYLKKIRSRTRTVAVKTQDGRLVASWPVDYTNAQAIANTIRDLKNWHSEVKGVWIDLETINEARGSDGLELLDSNGLPIAIGEALPQDMDVDLVMRGSDGFTEFERGLQRYMQAQKAQLEVPVAVGA